MHVLRTLTALLLSQVTLAKNDLPTTNSKPHIFMLLVDDWGWANVGYHRTVATNDIQTPNIDKLCAEGVELNQHYVHNVCSPTRSSLLSGRLPMHVNVNNGDSTMHNPKDPVAGFQGVPRNMTVIAEKMKEGGYATHQVGKWDAGMATRDHIPLGRGFDTSFGYFHHANDFYTQQEGRCKDKNDVAPVDLWATDKPAHGLNGTDYEEHMFGEHVLQVLKEHDPSVPLFLYYAPHVAHTPYQVPQPYLDKFRFIDDDLRRVYHAMVYYLDEVVGNITDMFKSKGMWNNTLVVVSADNGGPEHNNTGANNYPLKGGKQSNWQGGVRVNAFVSGGFVPRSMRGKKLEGYIAVCDWYATFCHLADVDPTDAKAASAKLPPIDSLNMWPYVSGQVSSSPRPEVPIASDSMVQGLISGSYKILIGKLGSAGWTGPQYPNISHPAGVNDREDCGDGCLFNIKTDPEERNNLAESMKDVLKDMQRKLARYQKTFYNPDRGSSDPAACDAAINVYKGFWGPWVT
ncbi:arylsulfatase J-like [Oscarella lobularis]|uniref:arylsulfatase J-like n=1 Tax=Oscarella lobularis TaxID=121494 RepID=UPI003313F285